MFCGKTNLGKLERHERSLSTISLEKSLSYNELFKKSGQLSVKMNLMRFCVDVVLLLHVIYSRTIAAVGHVFCWLYPTLNKMYLILSYLILSYDCDIFLS